jgi:hypothetical protein
MDSIKMGLTEIFKRGLSRIILINEKLHNLFSSPDIIGMMISLGHVACMETFRNISRILV